MRFTLIPSVVALAVLTAAAPRPAHNIGMAIPITKRSGSTNGDKSVDIEAVKSHAASIKAYVTCFSCCISTQAFLNSKILRGLNNFEKNTGAPHPAASALKGSQRRATGADPLTDYKEQLWYGTISVGTPANTFTGKFSCTVTEFKTHSFS